MLGKEESAAGRGWEGKWEEGCGADMPVPSEIPSGGGGMDEVSKPSWR